MTKVVLVTGASKGIGAATAIAFAQAGYDVAINYQSDTNAAELVAGQVESAGQKALLVQANAFTEEGVSKLFAAVKHEFTTIDVLVNNAADPSEPGFGKYTFADINKSLAENFAASVLCSQEAVKIMAQGCILFTSSIYGQPFGGNPTKLLYSASKAAMTNFAQTLAEVLGPDIRCNVVAPGATRTPAWSGASKDYVDVSLGMTIQKQWVEPQEIASAFVFLAETPHINAQTITIDSGWQKKLRAK